MTEPKPVHLDERLETPKQLAARVGLSERQVRHLIQTRQLEYVLIGSRPHVPVGAFSRFLEDKKVLPWRGETKDQGSVGSTSVTGSTLRGRTGAAAASARLARQTANKLKSSSRSGCSTGNDEQGQVIPLRSS